MLRVLDRYLLRQWLKIFAFTVVGFPLIVIVIEVVDNLSVHLARGLGKGTVALAYLFSLPDKAFLILPAAVLFATVFSFGSMAKHSEIVAAKASGVSFYRMLVPVLVASLLATGLGIVIGEAAPPATRRQLELLGDVQTYSGTARTNFVYRAEEGWTYTIRELNALEQRARHLVLEREGTGVEYPTLAIQAAQADYDTTTAEWTLNDTRFRIVAAPWNVIEFAADSMRVRHFSQRPDELLVEEKRPEEMRYVELGRYIESLERSGGDGRQLRVGQALKIAVPFTCAIIALFGAPMVMAAPRAGGAIGIAISLGTTLIFLTLIQLSRAVGQGGLIPPTVAAWLPNMAFGVTGLLMLRRVRT
jgi:lipopolysaccharide export system permease protein